MDARLPALLALALLASVALAGCSHSADDGGGGGGGGQYARGPAEDAPPDPGVPTPPSATPEATGTSG